MSVYRFPDSVTGHPRRGCLAHSVRQAAITASARYPKPIWPAQGAGDCKHGATAGM